MLKLSSLLLVGGGKHLSRNEACSRLGRLGRGIFQFSGIKTYVDNALDSLLDHSVND